MPAFTQSPCRMTAFASARFASSSFPSFPPSSSFLSSSLQRSFFIKEQIRTGKTCMERGEGRGERGERQLADNFMLLGLF